ncbi:MAG: magnesium/cobalt transporter CorA [Thermomicrobiaceae bacterium]|nr:magnesium/cobalt transporter CorA [Thermomicrobiaceae bacterium]
MIHLEVLRCGETPRAEVDLDELDSLIARPDNLVWIDLTDPTPRDFDLIAREFRFHPLALEDARKRHQRPKLDQYDDFLFIVFYAVRETGDARLFAAQEIAMFVGPNYLVTVHDGPVPEIKTTADRWRENVSQIQSRGVAVLLYSLLDTIVDDYFPILDAIAERTDDLEAAIFDGGDRESLQQIFLLRKTLLALRRVLGPERDLMTTLTRRDIELLGPGTAIYFNDVYDHVLRVTDAIDTYRDLLSGALDAYLSSVSNNLNVVMRTLTSWSIILMSLALVAGIYGMNFQNMPELHYHYGYFVTLAGMLFLGAGLFALFKHIDWL